MKTHYNLYLPGHHVSLTYTRVDKFHQTLGECSAGQFQTPLLLPFQMHYKREARLPLGSGNETKRDAYQRVLV